MKKIFSLLLSMSMMLSIFSFPVSAQAPESNSEFVAPDTVTGRLIDEEGNVILVTGHRRVTPMILSVLSDEDSVTYDYAIPMSNFSHEDKVSGQDATGYMSSSMTIYYTEYALGPNEYLLTKVSGSWRDPNPNDGTRVSETADVMANCTGMGTNNIMRRQVKEGSIKSGSSMSTGFQYSIQPAYGAMGATLTIALSQGQNRRWNLELECFPINPTT